MNRPKRPKVFRKYKNLSGSSTVARYELQKDAVTVAFTDRSVLRYTNQSVTPENIAKMKTLAAAGKGLGTFITSSLKGLSSRKVR